MIREYEMEDSLVLTDKHLSNVLQVAPRRSGNDFDFIDGAGRINGHKRRKVSTIESRGRLWQLSKTAWIFLGLSLLQGEPIIDRTHPVRYQLCAHNIVRMMGS